MMRYIRYLINLIKASLSKVPSIECNKLLTRKFYNSDINLFREFIGTIVQKGKTFHSLSHF